MVGFSSCFYPLLALLAGCAGTQDSAPIRERNSAYSPKPSPSRVVTEKPPAPVPVGFYRVQPGDTLYKIAFEVGQDTEDLATWNKLADPGRIRSGEVLRVQPPPRPVVAPRPVPASPPVAVRALPSIPGVAVRTLPQSPTVASRPMSTIPPATPPVTKPAVVLVRAAEPVPPAVAKPPPPAADDDAVPDIWSWPARGPILARYGEGLNKGIDIAGPRGMPVQAAAHGRVVYAGSGLRGYGKLIIIRHGKTLLSAYAHNSRILVAEGQNVTRGQVVGELGDSDADRVKLHFEIRELGKPVDPMNYLPNAG